MVQISICVVSEIIFTREADESLALCQPLLREICLLLCRALIHSNVLEVSEF